MQTSTIEESGASAQGLETRFALARAFFLERNVRHYASVLSAFGVDLSEKRRDHLTLLWNGRARVTPKDEAMVSAIETIVEQLKNAPEIAA